MLGLAAVVVVCALAVVVAGVMGAGVVGVVPVFCGVTNPDNGGSIEDKVPTLVVVVAVVVVLVGC